MVYIEHSKLDKGNRYHSLGLDPSVIAKQPEILSATLRTLLSKIRSVPRDHRLVRCENRRWEAKRRAAHAEMGMTAASASK